MSQTQLDQCRAGLDQCRAGLQRHIVGENAGRLMQGYFLARAAAIHTIPAAARGQGKKKSIATVASDSPPEGFLTWLAAEITWLSPRTAYHYMTAAATAGLTPDMSEDQAHAAATTALEAFAASRNWKFSDLYRPALQPPHGKTLTSGGTPQPAGQMWFDFYEQLADLTIEEGKAQRELVALPLPKLHELETATRLALTAIKAAINARK